MSEAPAASASSSSSIAVQQELFRSVVDEAGMGLAPGLQGGGV